MTKLEWGTSGERFYETGTDRGVLYVNEDTTVPWNGLVSVSEAPSGGEATPYYYDGEKYLNIATGEEFEATIEAFSFPPEFRQFDGSSSPYPGLIVTQQPRKSFGFSYRTLIGNDIDGTEAGYKIHLVYNALAAPANRSYKTMNRSPEPLTLSWAITTMPPQMDGFRPSAHLVIDSRLASTALIDHLENILYGTDDTVGYLPEFDELLEIFRTDEPFVVYDLQNGRYTAEGFGVVEQVPGVSFTLDDDTVTDHGDGYFDIDFVLY